MKQELTLDERIKALNDIDQEFENDVIRGFGEALNIIDELRERIKELEEELRVLKETAPCYEH